MSLAFDIKVCADFYDPARRVGAEVKHVKNVKELYMVHDYIQRVTRAYGEPPLHWYVILFGGAANSVTYDIPEGNWERVLKTSRGRHGVPSFRFSPRSEAASYRVWHLCRYQDLVAAPL